MTGIGLEHFQCQAIAFKAFGIFDSIFEGECLAEFMETPLFFSMTPYRHQTRLCSERHITECPDFG